MLCSATRNLQGGYDRVINSLIPHNCQNPPELEIVMSNKEKSNKRRYEIENWGVLNGRENTRESYLDR